MKTRERIPRSHLQIEQDGKWCFVYFMAYDGQRVIKSLIDKKECQDFIDNLPDSELPFKPKPNPSPEGGWN